MRTITTLLLLTTASHAIAQVLGDTIVMNFESGATLQLDSVYPAGCWQMGAPDKALFTAALSLPNALVTDTVQPYPSNTTCYAEFTLLADEMSGDFGRWIEFDQWLDLAPGSRAYIEARDSWSTDWSRLMDGWYNSGSVLEGPDGPEFESSTGGWEHVIFDSPCIGVLADAGPDRWYDPLMRLRFVLEAGDNSSGHDGWMIDDFRATATPCLGGIGEAVSRPMALSPNPADEHVLIDLQEDRSRCELRIHRGDGSLVLVIVAAGRLARIDVSQLPSGPYLLRSNADDAGQALLIVQH